MSPPRFPVAVHVLLLKGDDVLTEAALRETREEVGVVLRTGDITVVGVMHRKSDPARVDFFLASRLDRDAQEPKNCEPAKCSELVWADITRLPADVIPYVRRGIENFRSGLWFHEFGWNAAR